MDSHDGLAGCGRWRFLDIDELPVLGFDKL
jgi:hypothetical protein